MPSFYRGRVMIEAIWLLIGLGLGGLLVTLGNWQGYRMSQWKSPIPSVRDIIPDKPIQEEPPEVFPAIPFLHNDEEK